MFFSIIIPVFNTEKYIKQCIDSILSQDFLDFEIIAVDDGSTDQSGVILDDYAKDNPHVKVFHKKNGGQSSARNFGVKKASGKYLAFIDSDDFYLDSTFLSKLHERCLDDADIVAYKYKKYFENSKKFGECTYIFSDVDSSKGYAEVLSSLVKKDAFFCSCWSKVVKRDIIEKKYILFDENSRCEDMDWYFNVIVNAKSISLLDFVAIGYRQRENSVTSSINTNSIVNFFEFFEVWTRKVEDLVDDKLKIVLFNALAKLYLNLVISLAGNKKALKEYYKRLKEFEYLLKYNDNKRVKKFYKIKRILGLRFSIFILKILLKMR